MSIMNTFSVNFTFLLHTPDTSTFSVRLLLCHTSNSSIVSDYYDEHSVVECCHGLDSIDDRG